MKPQERIIQLQKIVSLAKKALQQIDWNPNRAQGIALEALDNIQALEMNKSHAVTKKSIR